jgi:glycosyltransferase involved in cell wall biosynthesis
MKTILVVHQSAELYGSDKTLLSLIQSLDPSQFRIIVLLPDKGPLYDKLLENNILCFISPVVKVARGTISIWKILALPFEIVKSLILISKILKSYNIDLVHSNTLAVFGGAIWAKIYKKPHLWHVHEIILHPQFLRYIYAWFLKYFSNEIICNSNATKEALISVNRSLNSKTSIILNGINTYEYKNISTRKTIRKNLNTGETDIIILLIGRINRWKGHNLLIKAATELYNRGVDQLHYLIVGSPPPGQNYIKLNLLNNLKNSPVNNIFTLWGFQEDIEDIYAECDIVVIPSIHPEPFGMVALEAMLSNKPVIAANHGGLVEIVVNNETGILFEPDNHIALAKAIQLLANDAGLRNIYGQKGCDRVKKHFSLQSNVESFTKKYLEILD